jgi:isopentenyldiphosphate isomerase
MSSLYQLVDDDDNIIAHKLRHKIDHAHDRYRTAALWLTNSRGDILIAQRVLTKDKDPGKWGPAAAGTLEKGETYESNVYKEAEEELGLTGIAFVIGPKFKLEKPRKAYCQWFMGTCDKREDEFVPQPEEVARVKWIEAKELLQDVETNQDSYVPSMPLILNFVYNSSTK